MQAHLKPYWLQYKETENKLNNCNMQTVKSKFDSINKLIINKLDQKETSDPS